MNQKQKEKAKTILQKIDAMKKLGTRRVTLSNNDYKTLFEYLHSHHVEKGFSTVKNGFYHGDVWIESLSAFLRNSASKE